MNASYKRPSLFSPMLLVNVVIWSAVAYQFAQCLSR